MRTIDRSISIRSPATCDSLAACRDTCCIFNQTPSAYRKQWLRFKPRQTSIIPAGENNSNVGALVRRSRLAAPVRRLSIFVTFRRRNPDARRRRGDLAPTATRLLDVISIICLRLWIIASNSRITFETFGGRWGQPRTYTDEKESNPTRIVIGSCETGSSIWYANTEYPRRKLSITRIWNFADKSRA